MSDRLLRPSDRLLVGLYYKAWLPSPRVPQGQAFAEYLEGRGLELVDSRALSASAAIVTVRALEEKTYRQASSNMVGGLAEATRIGLNVDAVVWYSTDAPPGLLERAVAPIAGAASALGTEARETTSAIRDTGRSLGDAVADFATAAKWIAIGIPLAGAALALGYIVWSIGKGRSL